MSLLKGDQRGLENYGYAQFPGIGEYGIPQVTTSRIQLPSSVEMVSFDQIKRQQHPENIGVHFFVDDYKFLAAWNNPHFYGELLRKFKFVCGPDFSLYTDFPKALCVYNKYRNNWLAAYWQRLGVSVVPSVTWCEEDSFEWCFDGDPVGGTIALCTTGTLLGDRTRDVFDKGFVKMLDAVKPDDIITYGRVPETVETRCAMHGIQLHRCESRGDELNARAKAARAEKKKT